MSKPAVMRPEHEGDPLGMRRVSDVSRFKDHLWELDRTNTAKALSSRCINWSASFGSYGNFTDEQYSDLLRTCKLLVYSLRNGKSVRGHLKGSSLVTIGVNLIVFVRWMIFEGFVRFSDVSTEDVLRYRTTVINNAGRFDSKTGRMRREAAATPLHPKTVRLRMQPIRYLVELRDIIGDGPDWDPIRDPGEDIGSARSRNHIPRIPDEIAIPLYTVALDWIANYAHPLIRLTRAARLAFEETKAQWKNRDYSFRAARRVLERSRLVIRTPASTFTVRSLDMFQFRRLLQYLETACYIIVAGFTGLRISEISGLKVNCLRSATINGVRTLVLESTLVKTAPGESERLTWVAGVDEPDNPVKLAVGVLADLRERERLLRDKDNLFLTRGHHEAWDNVQALTDQAMNWRLNQFMKLVHAPYAWRISTHQFRKTFARFVATAESCSLFALKRHFKHISLQMTDLYVGNDNELYALILEAQEEYARELLDVVLASSTLAGQMGEELCARNHQFRGVAGSDLRQGYIDSLLENTDISLMPNAYGLCVFRIDRAVCGGDRSRVGINTCLPCRNNIMGRPHLPWWQRRVDDLKSYLDSMPDKWLTHERRTDLLAEIERAKSVVRKIRRKTR